MVNLRNNTYWVYPFLDCGTTVHFFLFVHHIYIYYVSSKRENEYERKFAWFLATSGPSQKKKWGYRSFIFHVSSTHIMWQLAGRWRTVPVDVDVDGADAIQAWREALYSLWCDDDDDVKVDAYAGPHSCSCTNGIQTQSTPSVSDASMIAHPSSFFFQHHVSLLSRSGHPRVYKFWIRRGKWWHW